MYREKPGTKIESKIKSKVTINPNDLRWVRPRVRRNYPRFSLKWITVVDKDNTSRLIRLTKAKQQQLFGVPAVVGNLAVEDHAIGSVDQLAWLRVIQRHDFKAAALLEALDVIGVDVGRIERLALDHDQGLEVQLGQLRSDGRTGEMDRRQPSCEAGFADKQ